MKLIILDRDGVINHDSPDYIKHPDEWVALPGSLQAIARLHQAGYTIVVASNQSGLARGLFDESTLCDGVLGAPTYPARSTELRFRYQPQCCEFDIVAAHGTASQWLGLSRDGDVVDLLRNRSLCRLTK
ncbi:MAG: HAD-IIIA family hydrolase [Flavobacteriales bacterium]